MYPGSAPPCRTAASGAGSAGARDRLATFRPTPSPGASAPDRQGPKSPTSSARSSRCGTRCSAPTRAACRHRSTRARYHSPSHGLRAPPSSLSTCVAIGAACWSRRASRERRKRAEQRGQKPAEPDAFALSLRADFIHAVVPVAGADQRQPVTPSLQRPRDRAGAVLVERQLLGRRTGVS